MNWGDFVITTELQDFNEKWGMRGIPHIPVGTKCFVIKEVNTPGYDLLVCPEGYVSKVVDLDNGGYEEEYHTVYLYKNSWKPFSPQPKKEGGR